VDVMAGPGDPCCMYMPQQVSPPSFLSIEGARERERERVCWELRNPRSHSTHIHTHPQFNSHTHKHQHAASSTVPAAERKDVQHAAHDDKPV
jgi:hypothetical protein